MDANRDGEEASVCKGPRIYRDPVKFTRRIVKIHEKLLRECPPLKDYKLLIPNVAFIALDDVRDRPDRKTEKAEYKRIGLAVDGFSSSSSESEESSVQSDSESVYGDNSDDDDYNDPHSPWMRPNFKLKIKIGKRSPKKSPAKKVKEKEASTKKESSKLERFRKSAKNGGIKKSSYNESLKELKAKRQKQLAASATGYNPKSEASKPKSSPRPSNHQSPRKSVFPEQLLGKSTRNYRIPKKSDHDPGVGLTYEQGHQDELACGYIDPLQELLGPIVKSPPKTLKSDVKDIPKSISSDHTPSFSSLHNVDSNISSGDSTNAPTIHIPESFNLPDFSAQFVSYALNEETADFQCSGSASSPDNVESDREEDIDNCTDNFESEMVDEGNSTHGSESAQNGLEAPSTIYGSLKEDETLDFDDESSEDDGDDDGNFKRRKTTARTPCPAVKPKYKPISPVKGNGRLKPPPVASFSRTSSKTSKPFEASVPSLPADTFEDELIRLRTPVAKIGHFRRHAASLTWSTGQTSIFKTILADFIRDGQSLEKHMDFVIQTLEAHNFNDNDFFIAFLKSVKDKMERDGYSKNILLNFIPSLRNVLTNKYSNILLPVWATQMVFSANPQPLCDRTQTFTRTEEKRPFMRNGPQFSSDNNAFGDFNPIPRPDVRSRLQPISAPRRGPADLPSTNGSTRSLQVRGSRTTAPVRDPRLAGAPVPSTLPSVVYEEPRNKQLERGELVLPFDPSRPLTAEQVQANRIAFARRNGVDYQPPLPLTFASSDPLGLESAPEAESLEGDAPPIANSVPLPAVVNEARRNRGPALSPSKLFPDGPQPTFSSPVKKSLMENLDAQAPQRTDLPWHLKSCVIPDDLRDYTSRETIPEDQLYQAPVAIPMGGVPTLLINDPRVVMRRKQGNLTKKLSHQVLPHHSDNGDVRTRLLVTKESFKRDFSSISPSSEAVSPKRAKKENEGDSASRPGPKSVKKKRKMLERAQEIAKRSGNPEMDVDGIPVLESGAGLGSGQSFMKTTRSIPNNKKKTRVISYLVHKESTDVVMNGDGPPGASSMS